MAKVFGIACVLIVAAAMQSVVSAATPLKETADFPSDVQRSDGGNGWTKTEAEGAPWAVGSQIGPRADEYTCGWKLYGRTTLSNAGYSVNYSSTGASYMHGTAPFHTSASGSLEVHFMFRFVKRSFFIAGADVNKICKSGGYSTANGGYPRSPPSTQKNTTCVFINGNPTHPCP